MRSRNSIRGCVRPSVGRSVGRTRVEILQKCHFRPKLLAVRAWTHLMPCIQPCFLTRYQKRKMGVRVMQCKKVCFWKTSLYTDAPCCIEPLVTEFCLWLKFLGHLNNCLFVSYICNKVPLYQKEIIGHFRSVSEIQLCKFSEFWHRF